MSEREDASRGEDRLTRATEYLNAAEACIAHEASERHCTMTVEQRFERLADRARHIADMAEQAAENCAARRVNRMEADARLSTMFPTVFQEAAE